MGMGDVSDLVIPKPVLFSASPTDGSLVVRYFMPHECHPSLATTGAVGIATAAITPGTVLARRFGAPTLPAVIGIQHPSGQLSVDIEERDGQIVAGIIRTARRLFEGHVFAKPARLSARHETISSEEKQNA